MALEKTAITLRGDYIQVATFPLGRGCPGEQGITPWQPYAKIKERALAGSVKRLLWWLPPALAAAASGLTNTQVKLL